ncbi:MAG: zinc ribbon domain-containing protein [Betaproteobacteria bacterium]|jgi:putative FmdB family regulatory protein|nr:zinc ribbon domain-containing protein [Betaproteobacteria bacterium]MCC6248524.1 zinc ribbon domain-containing protein [Rubrivivax sp.]
MPIYAYRCTSCGHAKDVLQKVSDPLLTECPACGAATFAKQVTAAGFQLKGSGWYVTDFRGGNNGAAKADGEGKDGGADKAAEKSAEKTGASTGTEKSGEKATGTAAAAPAPAAAPAKPSSAPSPSSSAPASTGGSTSTAPSGS